jgi:radical SAM protein with 4Fe4S-binding SPASM domain
MACKVSLPPKTSVPEVPPRILLDLYEGFCNLKCPKCFVHCSENNLLLQKVRGRIPLNKALELYDEISAWQPLIQPQLWSEPLLGKEFRIHLREMKSRGIFVSLNTNGLLLSKDLAKYFVEIELESIFISIDAITSRTLKKVRGIESLDKIQKGVFNIISARNGKLIPRIGVSFTIQEKNRNEAKMFVDYWLEIVDVVRVGAVYENGKWQNEAAVPAKRVPCPALYTSMAVHHNGDVSVCCLDAYSETNVGNVFEKGVKAVWNGSLFSEIRKYHETGQYHKVPFCKNCNVWANFSFNEKIVDNLLIRESGGMTYYNRIDRLSSKEEILLKKTYN